MAFPNGMINVMCIKKKINNTILIQYKPSLSSLLSFACTNTYFTSTQSRHGWVKSLILKKVSLQFGYKGGERVA